MKNAAASALGKLARGKKKTLTPAEIARRTEQLARVRPAAKKGSPAEQGEVNNER